MRRSPPSRLFTLALLVTLQVALATGPATARALTAAKPLREYSRQSWQTESGLPQNTVHAVLQTRDGFLWIATEGGLVRFDGQDLLTFDTANTPEFHSNLINDLAEDDRGTLWIATADGLLALTPDPVHPRFTAYTTADGLPSNNVHSLRKRPGGLLLLTSAGAALLSSGHLQPVPDLATDIAPSLVTSGPNGTLWIAANRQILALAPGATVPSTLFSAAQIPASLGALQTIAATPEGDLQGDLWVGGRTGLALLSHNHPPVLLHPTPSDDITALLPQPNGSLWIGTAAGLSQYANGSLHAVPTQPAARARILQLFQDRSKALWIASDHGLDRLTPNATPQSEQPPLAIPGILSIFEDREGDMWFGTDAAGLTVLREQPFSTLTAADGLSGDLVRAVFQDNSGTRWIGTDRGLDRLRAGHLTSLPGLQGTIVLALAETLPEPAPGTSPHPDSDLPHSNLPSSDLPPSDPPPSNLWIGTPDGLYRLRDSHLTHLTTADGLPDDFVRSLFADTDGTLWIGTRNGLAHLNPVRLSPAHPDPATPFTLYSRRDGLGSDVIGTILRTRSGTLWVGTLAGLSRLDGARFRNYIHTPNAPHGLSGDAITTLHEDRQGTLWIAAHDAGLTRLRDGVFTPLHAPPGKLPQEIFSILEDTQPSSAADPTLWLGAARGVYRVSLDSLNALADRQSTTLPTTVFGTADGMKISECSSGGHPAGWRMQDGSLWFATLKGVAFLQPASGFDNRVPPLTAIEQILIDSGARNQDAAPESANPEAGNPATTSSSADTLTIPPGTEHLTLHYAGLSFAAPQKVRFRYKLEGFDRDWIDAGTRHTAFYTNLPPGKYRFLVYAANNDGVWSLAPATLAFTLQPHLYQTRWFLLLCGLALVALGYLVYRSRVRLLARQYQAVLAERTRIAREIHDTLAQGYVGISVQLEVASRLLKTSPEAAASQLDLTKELVRSSLAEARSSIWELRSPETADSPETDSLPLRLAADIEARRQADGPAIRLDVRGAARSLDRRLEDQFLRVAQEAVANALRHAGAHQITLILTYAPNSLELQVSDDGIGFHTPPGGFAATGHFGLKGIEERAATIGAKLHIRSQRGQGTTLLLTCPLAPARRSGNGAGRVPSAPSVPTVAPPPLQPTQPLKKKEAQ
ncbi:MAG TPA: two-component regulator propeller domain-containing protein [Granulicella sp.]|nr:two-component regulator propeller domain-containing protein [Granulicella sp.]